MVEKVRRGPYKADAHKKTLDMAAYQREWRKANKDKAVEYQRRYYEAHPEKKKEKRKHKYLNQMRKLHGDGYVVGDPANRKNSHHVLSTRIPMLELQEKRLRRNCRVRTMRAVKKGKLDRQPCFVCGNEESQAHHVHYELPFAVTWLCVKHHREIHEQFTVYRFGALE